MTYSPLTDAWLSYEVLRPFRRDPGEAYDEHSERLAFFTDWLEWHRALHLRRAD